MLNEGNQTQFYTGTESTFVIPFYQGCGTVINYGSETRTVKKWNHKSYHRHSIKLCI